MLSIRKTIYGWMDAHPYCFRCRNPLPLSNESLEEKKRLKKQLFADIREKFPGRCPSSLLSGWHALHEKLEEERRALEFRETHAQEWIALTEDFIQSTKDLVARMEAKLGKLPADPKTRAFLRKQKKLVATHQQELDDFKAHIAYGSA